MSVLMHVCARVTLTSVFGIFAMCGQQRKKGASVLYLQCTERPPARDVDVVNSVP